MRKGNLLWLCIATTLILTNVVMSQDPDRNPDERKRKAELKERRERRGRAGQERLKTFIMERLDSLLQQVGESIGQRYKLEETTIKKLRQPVRESVQNQLKQEKDNEINELKKEIKELKVIVNELKKQGHYEN